MPDVTPDPLLLTVLDQHAACQPSHDTDDDGRDRLTYTCGITVVAPVHGLAHAARRHLTAALTNAVALAAVEHEPRWEGTGYGGGSMVCRCGDGCVDGYAEHLTDVMRGRHPVPALTDADPDVERVDKYRLRVFDVTITATRDQEAAIRAMTGEQRERFARIMGGRQ